MADVAFEDLPLYLVEPKVQPARRTAPPVPWSPAVRTVGNNFGSTLVMTRIVPLVPSVAVDALMAWWRRRQSPDVPYGRKHFELSVPAVRDDCYDECLMGVRLHHSCRRPTLLEVELSPWSTRLTELDLRPLRWTVSPSESYFAAGHALLDMLERAMQGQAARRPVLRRRTGLGTG